MSNDRNRNQLADSPNASKPAKLPSIPAVRTSADLVPFAQALKQHIDARTAATGNPFEKWVTLRDVSQIGLLGSPQLKAIPSDFAGVPVWTSRKVYAMLTMQALAEAMTDYLSDADKEEDSPVTRQEFDLLVQRVAAIRPGVTTSEVQQLLTQLRSQLTEEWRRDIERALAGIDVATLQDALDAATRAIAMLNRLALGYRFDQATPALVWTCVHRLQRYPTISVMDATGEKIEPDIVFNDIDTVTITHGRATAGKAIFK